MIVASHGIIGSQIVELIPFKFTINTAIAGTSGVGKFQLPLVSSLPLNAIVNWGDGNSDTITTFSQAETLHTYASSGTYTISISGDLSGWQFAGGGDSLKMLNVVTWGALNISVNAGFFGCTNLTCSATDVPIITSASLLSYFQSCSNFNGAIGNWNVSNVTTMSSMFKSANVFNQPIGSWNTSAVTDMSSMFRDATAFNQNIGAWNVSNVTNFNAMFSQSAFKNGNSNSINNWAINTTNFVTMGGMFNNSPFNQPIGNWDVSMVTNMSEMLRLTNYNLYIGDWNTQNVTNMNSIFQWNGSFNQNIAAKTINAGLPNEYIAWNVSKVIDFSYAFWYNTSFNQPIGNWTFTNINPISMPFMFNNATVFNQPIGSWNTSAVTDMSYMFRDATAFNQDIGAWNVSNVTTFTNFMAGKTNLDYSAANLDSIYNGWSSRPVKPNLSILFGAIKYTAASQAGKDILDFAPNNWTIIDGGI